MLSSPNFYLFASPWSVVGLCVNVNLSQKEVCMMRVKRLTVLLAQKYVIMNWMNVISTYHRNRSRFPQGFLATDLSQNIGYSMGYNF